MRWDKSCLWFILFAAFIFGGSTLWCPVDASDGEDGLKVDGDFRYRYERIDQEDKDVYDRHRLRARVGLAAMVNDQTHFFLRLASGSTDPISTNQTLDDASSSKGIWLDRAYLDIRPVQTPGLNLMAGKISNPFYTPQKSQLIWDGDLNPEGLAAKFSHGKGALKLFASGSGWIIDNRKAESDVFMYGLQGGINREFDEQDLNLTAGASFFSYTELKDKPLLMSDSFGNSTPDDAADIYANEYTLIEGFFKAAFSVARRPVALFADFVTNTDPSEENVGWMAGVEVGKAMRPGTAKVSYNYRELQRDAVLGIFSDSDFAGGGTNAKGHQISVVLKLMTNLDAGAIFFANTRGIADGEDGLDYQRLQVDLMSKF
ncbi:MAG: putative porin [Candidatus Eisenbacteria bacterium]|uniref:Porin n=1 Tax=Eiseniibacteriota bacterium TaxID=2212470 RepID=A0A948RYJ8_UNCEI|nr:putative porin [Candidatus Eisenbacteria bacterium]MBU1951073.1 putative porin [Candidatus Eisenbacteria bacterium]MBU2693210.1 putative porin [Candidatus Eisenbacteria bacterium]